MTDLIRRPPVKAILKAAFEGPPYDLQLPIFIPGNSGTAKGR
jgi:hypothetical protein